MRRIGWVLLSIPIVFVILVAWGLQGIGQRSAVNTDFAELAEQYLKMTADYQATQVEKATVDSEEP